MRAIFAIGAACVVTALALSGCTTGEQTAADVGATIAGDVARSAFPELDGLCSLYSLASPTLPAPSSTTAPGVIVGMTNGFCDTGKGAVAAGVTPDAGSAQWLAGNLKALGVQVP